MLSRHCSFLLGGVCALAFSIANAAAADAPTLYLRAPHYTEAPTFDRAGNLWFSQTATGLITEVDPHGNQHVWARVAKANGHAIEPDGDHIVMSSAGAVVRLAPDGSLRKTIATAYDGRKLIYPNDVTIDARTGGFYFTDSGATNGNDDPVHPRGRIYYVDAHDTLHLAASDIRYANGIALAPPGDRLYVSESNRNRVLTFAILGPGKLGARRVFANMPSDSKHVLAPDGIALDASGNVYVAHYGHGQVQVFAPNGSLIRRYPAGVLTTSDVAFGGPKLGTLYITGGIGEESGAGGIFKLDVPARGLDVRPTQ